MSNHWVDAKYEVERSRVKALRMSQSFFRDFFSPGEKPLFTVTEGLPKDAQVVNAWVYEDYVELTIWSAEFEPVKPCDKVPQVWINSKLRMCPACNN